jgi:hypothetical protein
MSFQAGLNGSSEVAIIEKASSFGLAADFYQRITGAATVPACRRIDGCIQELTEAAASRY